MKLYGLANVLLISMLFYVTACGGALKDKRSEAGFYGAELLACVQYAETLEESRTCRARVAKAHGRPVEVFQVDKKGDAGK